MILFFVGSVALATEPSIDMTIRVDKDQPRNLKLSITYSGLSPLGQGNVCFYVPYQDSTYGDFYKADNLFSMIDRDSDAPTYLGGSTHVRPKWGRVKLEWIDEHIIRYDKSYRRLGHNKISLEIDSTLPTLTEDAHDTWYYDGFYPIPLARCPKDGEGVDPLVDVHFDVRIDAPHMTVGAPGFEVINADGSYGYQLRGNRFAFGLSTKLVRDDFKLGGVDVSLFYEGKEMKRASPAIKKAIESGESWLGAFPQDRLVVFQAPGAFGADAAGIVPFSRPSQKVFSNLQKESINISDWLMIKYILSQWIGAKTSVKNPDDRWLLYGLREYITERIVTNDKKNKFLFKGDDNWLNLEYRQLHHMTLSALDASGKFAPIVDQDLKTVVPLEKQTAFYALRQAASLGALEVEYGRERLIEFFKELVGGAFHKRIGLRAYLDGIAQLCDSDKKLLKCAQPQQMKWWTTDAWSDLHLKSWKVSPFGKKYKVDVETKQEGDLSTPHLIRATDIHGDTYDKVIDGIDVSGDASHSFLISSELRKLEIDPERALYDPDRFNNSNQFPSMKFFPGDANTLSDEDYTLAWVPYAFKKPGQGTSLAMQGSLFKYTLNLLAIKASYTPEDEKGDFSLTHTTPLWMSSLKLLSNISQRYSGDRAVNFTLVRQIKTGLLKEFQIHSNFSHVNSIDEELGTYSTLGFRIYTPLWEHRETCKFNAVANIEFAPKSLSPQKTYTKLGGHGETNCKITPRTRLEVRGFRGVSLGIEESKNTAGLFVPNDLDGPQIRIDQKDMAPVRDIWSVSTDLYIPFWAPIPNDIFIVRQRLRFRLFYDLGFAKSENAKEFRSSGLGLYMPLGGAFSGMESFTLSKFSILAVLFSKIDDEELEGTSILFSFTGEI